MDTDKANKSRRLATAVRDYFGDRRPADQLDGDQYLYDLAMEVEREYRPAVEPSDEVPPAFLPPGVTARAVPQQPRQPAVAVGSSGATSSHAAALYDEIPRSFLRRLAERFGLGSVTHGRGNWKRSVDRQRYDIKFIRDRYNHAVEHLLAIPGSAGVDDHIGAVGWAMAYLSWIEKECGLDLSEILKVRTPEDEAKYFEAHDVGRLPDRARDFTT